jgi:asparagine synthase (glutamine-hydrolysing)
MIDAKIFLTDIPDAEDCDTKTFAFGRSLIAGFASKLIKMSVKRSGNAVRIWAGETDDPVPFSSSVEDQVKSYRRNQGGDGICILHAGDEQAPRIGVARTSAGSCPIYISAHEDCLVVSWRYEAAVAILPNPQPNIAACRLFLTEAITHTRDQIIAGTYILWPGESVIFDAAGLSFQEIEPVGVVRPTPLSDNSRASEQFLQVIADACAPLIEAAERPLLELSGGYDSSCVGLAISEIRQDLLSYGIVQEGAIGVQQSARRTELLSIVRSQDFEYPAYARSPYLSVLEDEEQHLTCMDDSYRVMCASALEAAPYASPDLVITGIGGDELSMQETYLRHSGELRGNCSSSAISAAMCRYDVFLRRGIWVSHPLIAQDVVDYCRALPDKFRANRNLNVLALARAGLSDGFIFPRYPEHFGNMLQRYAVLHDFDDLLADSVVGDYGIADISALLQTARDATAEGFSYEMCASILFLVKLEAVLRNYVR